LVLYAHGYVAPDEPLAIPELGLDDSTSIDKFFTDLGYAFATTSYSKNGLAVKEGIEDLADLTNIFQTNFGRTRNVYLIGASEGGLITTLSMEKNFFLYSGAVSLCSPSGDFQKQINHFADFRLIFDYYFPGIIPGSAIDIPQEVIDNYQTKYLPAIIDAVAANPESAAQVLNITKTPIALDDREATATVTFANVLWYNIFATNNAKEVLGGQPFDNSQTIYKGGLGMAKLNASITRFKADEQAINEIQKNYSTTGRIFKPMVMLHNIKDPVVLKSQQDDYIAKVANEGNSELLLSKAPPRYGHCNFESDQLMKSFIALVYQVTGEAPIGREELIRRRKMSIVQ
jgi:hypothetical protein